jgi:putative glutamine amidotransferase
MKLIGIVGRAYYNKDNQKIIQLNEAIRKALAKYDNVVSILLLPTNDEYYATTPMGEDKLNNIDKEKLNYILNKCDAFIVPGGSNWYNFDEYVIEYAIKNDRPLLAICVGFQALCSMDAKDRYKFDMTKNLENDSHYGKEDKYFHNINILDNSLLKKIIDKDKIQVNSLHHSYIDSEFNNLIVTALSENGIIEAVEWKNKKFIIGLEWHPEYLMDEESLKIFDSFINSIN